MKKLILLGLVAIVFTACQKQRYFAESAEIETLKAGIAAYEAGDWETWRSHIVDTAKFYVNTKEAVGLDARVEALKGMSSAFSSYGFDKEEQFTEMVLDKKDETWVYFWGDHSATIAANNKTLSIPVHLAVRFVDGKIVEEHVFFDTAPLNAAMQEEVPMESEESSD